jgi:regulatory protein YycI of two-component signal transduction system YycFG
VRITVRSATFGYYTLPPREYQGMLIPVYAIAGTVSTRILRRPDFVRYGLAEELAASEVKELGIVGSELPRIIN